MDPIFIIKVLTAVNFLLGGGIVGLIVKAYLNRRQNAANTAKTLADKGKTDAETEKAEAETEALHHTTDAGRLIIIGNQQKTIGSLIEDADANIKKMRDTNSQLAGLQEEHDKLKVNVAVKDGVIEYQKEERHQWTLTLKSVLEASAEMKQKMLSLEKRIVELEAANEELTKGDLMLQGEK